MKKSIEKKYKQFNQGQFNFNTDKHASELFKTFVTNNFTTRAFHSKKYSRKEKHHKDFYNEDSYDAFLSFTKIANY